MAHDSNAQLAVVLGGTSMRLRPARVRPRPGTSVSGSSGAGGFSVIELLVVISITLVLAAIATPNIVDAIANVKLRSSANSVAALLQQTRLLAVHDNKYYTVRTNVSGNLRTAYIDTTPATPTATDGSGNGSFDTGEPLTQVSGTTQFAQSGAPTFNTSSLLGFTPVSQTAVAVSFNSRGLPCKMSGSVCSPLSGGAPVGYLFYLTDLRPQYGWAAVSVSPSGRIKVWYYNGSTWE
jgi:prepilin-type N-terminal cleavage/methylation domain-containing protein